MRDERIKQLERSLKVSGMFALFYPSTFVTLTNPNHQRNEGSLEAQELHSVAKEELHTE